MANIWQGKKYLKLEHCLSPWYSTDGGRDVCLKHYFTLWGWCLALRLHKSGYKPGIISEAEYMFGYVNDTLTKNFRNALDKDPLEVFCNPGKINDGYSTLYCYNHEGDLLGSLDDFAWMFEYKCIADANLIGVAYSQKEKGYIGYSHRARQVFRIGDRLFDAKYVPKEEDYEEFEWAGFIQKQKQAQDRNDKDGWQDRVRLRDVVPFRLRGATIIKTPKEARKAAHNFAKDVS
jgi:hypothetical protein